MLTISYDARTNIVRTVAEGFTPAEELERYLAELQCHVRRARAETGRFLHLVDAANNAVQSRDNFENIARIAAEIGHESDRNAVVMQSMLAKMQIALLSTSASIRIFSDVEEAEAWLIAEGQVKQTPGAA